MASGSAASDGFLTFYRRYAKSGVHAGSAAAMTAFGLLATVHWAFIVVAVAAYLCPLLYFYYRRDHVTLGDESETPTVDGDRSASERTRTGRKTTSESRTDGRDRLADADARRNSADSDSDDGDTDSDSDSDSDDGDTDSDSDSDDGDTDSDSDDGDTDSDSDDGDTDSDSASDTATAARPRWTVADAPPTATLTDVVVAGSRAYAVGDGGVVFERRDGAWESVLEGGPGGDGESLVAVDATDDGNAVWFAGDGGALGRFDVDDGRWTDHSAPNDNTTSWTDVAVAGEAGAEVVYLVNGSGAVLRGEYDADDADRASWRTTTKPGSGSSLSGVVAFDAHRALCCDTNATVFETRDGATSFEVIGIDAAEGALVDLAAADSDDADVIADDGTVYRYDGDDWTTGRIDDSTSDRVEAVTPVTVARAGEYGLLAGERGLVCERRATGDASNGRTADWSVVETPTSATLRGVGLGGSDQRGDHDGLGVAVGADGLILERRA